MTAIALDRAEHHLLELVRRAEQGEEILLCQGDQPLARIVPVDAAVETRRTFGQHRGKAHLSEEFDAPLPDDFWLSGKP